MPGVLSFTSWETMRSSYRFPVRVLECDLGYWTIFVHHSDMGRAATASAGLCVPLRTPVTTTEGAQEGSVGLDDLDLFLGDLAVHDAERAEGERAFVIAALGGGDEHVVGAGLVGVHDVRA